MTGSMTSTATGPPAAGDTAGLSREAVLDIGYAQCARLTREYGTTYFWGAVLLGRESRRQVHAVYALCRLADDIVDDAPSVAASPSAAGRDLAGRDIDDPADTAARLAHFRDAFAAALAAGTSPDPVLAAVADTALRAGIDPECFDRFFGAMAMDLTRSRYDTFADLCGYMEGSAAVIGEMMLPVLRPTDPAAREPARSLGFAFQLTNFLRDVAEDLDRGRVYLPQDDLTRFGVDPRERRADRAWGDFMAFQIARNRDLYRHADTGIAMLPPRSARCVATARRLYAQILDRIEAADYDVFTTRVRVPTWRKAGTAARILLAGPPTVGSGSGRR